MSKHSGQLHTVFGFDHVRPAFGGKTRPAIHLEMSRQPRVIGVIIRAILVITITITVIKGMQVIIKIVRR